MVYKYFIQDVTYRYPEGGGLLCHRRRADEDKPKARGEWEGPGARVEGSAFNDLGQDEVAHIIVEGLRGLGQRFSELDIPFNEVH